LDDSGENDDEAVCEGGGGSDGDDDDDDDDDDDGSETEDSDASALEDEDREEYGYDFGSDYSEDEKEETEHREEEKEKENGEEEGKSDESSEGSEVSDKGEEKGFNQPEPLFKANKHTSSSKLKKSSTKISSKTLQGPSKNNIINKLTEVVEGTTHQADDEYKSDTSDEEVGNDVMYSVFHMNMHK
jgi:hypothetical protein